MTRSRVTFATIEAAAIAALFVSPSTTARCSGAVGPSRKPSTRHASAGGERSASTERSPQRFERCRPLRSMSVQGMTRTLMRAAQPTTARKSSSRSAGETCFESFNDASGRTRWLRRQS